MNEIYSIIDEYGCAVTKAYKTEEKMYDEFLSILENDPYYKDMKEDTISWYNEYLQEHKESISFKQFVIERLNNGGFIYLSRLPSLYVIENELAEE